MTNRPTKRPANPYASNKTTAKRPFVPPKETWTHDMCVLNKINANVTPTKEELERLRLAGLGRKKLVFPSKNANFQEFANILVEKYPKLKDGGGFQLLRAIGGGGGVRSLDPIPPGIEGYSIPYLQESQCLGQAILYVSSLQANLSMEKQVNKRMKTNPFLAIVVQECDSLLLTLFYIIYIIIYIHCNFIRPLFL